jgi:hypothetical protein
VDVEIVGERQRDILERKQGFGKAVQEEHGPFRRRTADDDHSSQCDVVVDRNDADIDLRLACVLWHIIIPLASRLALA